MASRMAPEQMFLFPIDAPPAPVVIPTVVNQALSPQRAASVVPPTLAAASAACAVLPSLGHPRQSESSANQRDASQGKPLNKPPLNKPPLNEPLGKPSLDQLRAQVARIQSRGRIEEASSEPRFSAGGAALNQLLPHGGFRRGTIVQWVGEAEGSGASSLATIAAAEIAESELSGGKPLVIFDMQQGFYPPAAVALGVPADRMVIVQKKGHHTHADMIWAIDQALRCDAVAAVWAELGPWLNDRDARRLQLAAEAGGTVGLFVRPASVRRRPSFADVSWYVAPYRCLPPQQNGSRRRLRVEVDRCRGGAEGATATVEIHSQLIPEAMEMSLTKRSTGRVVAFHAPASSAVSEVHTQPMPASTYEQSNHESKVASDLVRRLADPTLAKRRVLGRSERDQKRAS